MQTITSEKRNINFEKHLETAKKNLEKSGNSSPSTKKIVDEIVRLVKSETEGISENCTSEIVSKPEKQTSSVSDETSAKLVYILRADGTIRTDVAQSLASAQNTKSKMQKNYTTINLVGMPKTCFKQNDQVCKSGKF